MRATTTEQRRADLTGGPTPVTEPSQPAGRSTGLPVRRDLTPAYAVSFGVAILMAVVSAAPIAFFLRGAGVRRPAAQPTR